MSYVRENAVFPKMYRIKQHFLNDKIEDIKNFAMVKFKTNGDIGLFTEKEGNILFDPSQLIKEAGLMKEECIIIKDFDEF